VFSIGISADFNPQRFPHHPFKRRGMTRRGPQFQFRIARRPHLQQVVVASIAQLEPGDRLSVASVEAFRES
jgi:hypothetical protein